MDVCLLFALPFFSTDTAGVRSSFITRNTTHTTRTHPFYSLPAPTHTGSTRTPKGSCCINVSAVICFYNCCLLQSSQCVSLCAFSLRIHYTRLFTTTTTSTGSMSTSTNAFKKEDKEEEVSFFGYVKEKLHEKV